MSLKNDITSLGATNFAIGTSTIFRIIPSAYITDWQLRYVSGGSLEIVPTALSGTSTAAQSGWGTGYVMGTTEVVRPYGPATVYLAASGATVVAQMTLFYSSGITLK